MANHPLIPCNQGVLRQSKVNTMTLLNAVEGNEYIIRSVDTGDEEMDSFLFSLGCYAGEPITVVSHLKGSCVVSIKDGRYTIDRQLADTVSIQ